jgi:hypothetical protein
METVQEDKITFEQIKEVYKEMMKERAKEKFRIWDADYKKKRYHADPEFRAQRLASSNARRLRIKAEKEATPTKTTENI